MFLSSESFLVTLGLFIGSSIKPIRRQKMTKQLPTFSKAVEEYLSFKEAGGLSSSTLRIYRTDLKKFTDWSEDLPIDEVTAKQYEEFFRYLKNGYQTPNPMTGEPRTLSAKTIQNVWGALSGFWLWAEEHYDVDSPFSIPKPAAKVKPIIPLKQEEIERLLKAVKEKQVMKVPGKEPYKARRPTEKRDKAMILTFLDTGVRVSELCNMKIDDLEIKEKRIFVNGKGDLARYVYIGKICQRAIWLYLTERYPDVDTPREAPLFADQSGEGKLHRNSVASLVGRLGKRAGIKGLHPHLFRHTFAIQFLRNGGNAFTLQKLLGHSTLEMVKRYVNLAEYDLEKAHSKASPIDNWKIR
jgi:integrase/recombinase XerD